MKNIQTIIDGWAILGRPGYAGKRKQLRRAEIERKFGKGNWKITHLIDGKLLSREEALAYFEDSYFHFFKKNPEILDWLLLSAVDIYDTAPSNIDSKLDYTIQETNAAHLTDIAIRRVISRLKKSFKGEKLIQIHGEESEGFILTTGQVPFYNKKLIHSPQIKGWWSKDSVESFWQSNKVLAVKYQQLQRMSNKMVGVILRKDIHMGKGKFATQAAHAIVTLLAERGIKWDFVQNPIDVWTVKGEDSLLGIHSTFSKQKYNCSIIRDAGKTQLIPGTRTAVGVGPINTAEFDLVMSKYNALPAETKDRSYQDFESLNLRDL